MNNTTLSPRRVEVMAAELRATKLQNAQITSKFKLLQEAADTAKRQSLDFESKLQKTEETNQELQQLVADLQDRLKSTEELNMQGQQSFDCRISNMLSYCQHQQASFESEKARMQAERNEKDEQLGVQLETSAQLKAENNKLKDDTEILKHENETLQKQNAELKEWQVMLEDEALHLEEIQANLKSQISELEKMRQHENSQLTKELETAKIQLSDLTNRLFESTQNETKCKSELDKFLNISKSDNFAQCEMAMIDSECQTFFEDEKVSKLVQVEINEARVQCADEGTQIDISIPDRCVRDSEAQTELPNFPISAVLPKAASLDAAHQHPLEAGTPKKLVSYEPRGQSSPGTEIRSATPTAASTETDQRPASTGSSRRGVGVGEHQDEIALLKAVVSRQEKELKKLRQGKSKTAMMACVGVAAVGGVAYLVNSKRK